MLKTVLHLLCLLLLTTPVAVQAQFTCATNADGTLTIVSYTGAGGDLVIPANINGLMVTGLGPGAFAFGSNITSVTIPASITSVGDNPFFSCRGLTNAIFEDGVTTIFKWMFNLCENLRGVTIPDSVTSIGASAFGGTAFTQFTVPANVTNIASAFVNCTGLTNVVLPVGLIDMDSAFVGCSNLPGLTIPSTVTSIAGTFGACSSLTNVLIPETVTNIGPSTFAFCTGLGSFTIPASIMQIPAGSIQDNYIEGQIFTGCTNLTNLIILGSPIIGEYAFAQGSFRSVSIAGGTIGSHAFDVCTNLMQITLGNGVTYIGGIAFGAITVTNLFIPGSVAVVGQESFWGTGMQSIVFGAGVGAISDQAIDEGSSLSNILFLGNAPVVITGADLNAFAGSPATVYYLPGTTGWSNTFGTSIYLADGSPTVLWNPTIQSTGVSNGQFGFNITGTPNIPIVVLACTNLANPVWTALQGMTLTNGAVYFSDTNSLNNPARFYGIGFP
jgi:hypothetical protein